MPEHTIHEAAEAFLGHLREQGKKERTLYTYRKDLEIVEAFFSGDKKMSSIRTPQVGKFFKSNTLLKLPTGRERAKPTLDKTVRVFRMFLVWAKDTGQFADLPLPKDTPMGHSRVKEQDDDGQQ